MSYRLPSLSLLRTFEAAARHLNFKQAAAEVCVSPAAVSQQVKALEDYLGVPLFHRRARTLELSQQGAAMLPSVRKGLDHLAEAVEISCRQPEAQLSITAPPFFASHWLVPRLARFTTENPGVELRISSTNDAAGDGVETSVLDKLRLDPRDARCELAILYGKGRYEGFKVVPLFTPEYVPVCAPCLLQGKYPLQRPEDLAQHVLIHDDTVADSAADSVAILWTGWLRRVGLANIDAQRGPHFSNAVLALEAAQSGQGVALAPRPLIESRLREGSLTIPFDIGVPSPSTYFLVVPEMASQRPAVETFVRWIIAESATP